MRATERPALWLMMAGLLAGCASAGSGGSSGRDYTVITAEEIAETAPQVSNLYQLVERLRPRWLEARSSRSMSGFTEIVVFQGQTLLGNVSEMRLLGPEYAHWLEYMDASEATARLSGLRSRSIGGAIVLHLQQPRR